MNLVDSTGWLEYFADGKNSDVFSPPVEDLPNLIVSAISVCEVFKRILQQREENDALQAIALMQQGQIIDVDSPIAMNAAKISHDSKLPMADSLVLATARMRNAVLWTQDSDFEKIPNLKYVRK